MSQIKQKKRIAPLQVSNDDSSTNSLHADLDKGRKTWKGYLDKISDASYIQHLEKKGKQLGIPQEYAYTSKHGTQGKHSTQHKEKKQHIGVQKKKVVLATPKVMPKPKRLTKYKDLTHTQKKK